LRRLDAWEKTSDSKKKKKKKKKTKKKKRRDWSKRCWEHALYLFITDHHRDTHGTGAKVQEHADHPAISGEQPPHVSSSAGSNK
jgi:hypothetical protein